jgi:hypothetical protein
MALFCEDVLAEAWKPPVVLPDWPLRSVAFTVYFLADDRPQIGSMRHYSDSLVTGRSA